jgi:hypothetical protein
MEVIGSSKASVILSKNVNHPANQTDGDPHRHAVVGTLERLSRDDIAALKTEAAGLLTLAAPGARDHRIRIAPAD